MDSLRWCALVAHRDEDGASFHWSHLETFLVAVAVVVRELREMHARECDHGIPLRHSTVQRK